MTSLPVKVLLYIKSFPEQSRIILLLPYKILERFFDKYRGYANFKKGPRFFETPCSCYNFSLVYVRALCVRCACVHPSGLVRVITCTFVHGFQNNLAQLFSLRSRNAI